MDVIRDIEHVVNDLGIRILRLEPYAYGDGMTYGAPPNEKLYWPKSFVSFIKTYGQDKVLWGTDYPLLSFERCMKEDR